MTCFSTYCSAKKRETENVLPAIDRYLSKRIDAVHVAAEALGLPFAILSGQYGLLSPDDPILYYDHLLVADEVSEHARLVAEQLSAKGVDDLVFFTVRVTEDPAVAAYIDCVRLATQMVHADLKIIHVSAQD